MIPLRVLLLQTRKITVKLAGQSLPQVFNRLPRGLVNLTDSFTCQSDSYVISKLPQGQVNFMDMQSADGSDTDIHVVELETTMEHDSDRLLTTPAPGALVDVSNEEGSLQSSPCAKARIDPEPSAQQEKKEKRKPKKARDLGFTTSEKNVKKKRKRGHSGRGESEEDGDKKKKKQPRPNYFVSIPITNPKIKEGIQVVQDLVIQKDHRYSRALIPVGSLHITLLVTYLSNEEEVSMATFAVAQMKQTLLDLLQGRELVLPFSGIGQFRNEVAFAQLAEGEHVSTLTEIAEAVRKAFEERGVSSGDSKAFTPHLTFMKLSRAPKLRSQGVKKIDPEAYGSFVQHSFGEETVSRLDLCSMLKKKAADGYYHCETSVTFDLVQGTPRASRTSDKKGAEPDDEELLSLSKRLVEDAVLKAVQQYMEETQQSASGPEDQGPPKPGHNLNASASKAPDVAPSPRFGDEGGCSRATHYLRHFPAVRLVRLVRLQRVFYLPLSSSDQRKDNHLHLH
ncbi:hypothetical protein AAFF_G00178620 [Aldrovandia affinis]|uniref:A-kinase anchoring protein 7 n=1 Tax=Aldrovandia affinis TaxID=143900 RepID=A0AAD7RKR9_9TELE|nr:hypothetical protein AAFF_G00178620 [Aldrovandia affinis]